MERRQRDQKKQEGTGRFRESLRKQWRFSEEPGGTVTGQKGPGDTGRGLRRFRKNQRETGTDRKGLRETGKNREIQGGTGIIKEGQGDTGGASEKNKERQRRKRERDIIKKNRCNCADERLQLFAKPQNGNEKTTKNFY